MLKEIGTMASDVFMVSMENNCSLQLKLVSK